MNVINPESRQRCGAGQPHRHIGLFTTKGTKGTKGGRKKKAGTIDCGQ